MEFLQSKNECNVWLVQDFDGEAVNPRLEQDHHTEIFFYGTRNLRAFGPDQIVDRETYDERLEDSDYHTLECSEVVGQRPGIALISIHRDAYDKEYGGSDPQKALAAIAAEYALWAEGEVYGYRVFNSRGELKDECYGFIGEEYAKEAALEALEDVSANEPMPTTFPGKVFEVTV